MRKSIQELIAEGGDYLNEHGYKKKSQAAYWRAWRLFEEWCLDRGKHLPSSEDVELFISEGRLDFGNASYVRQLKRAVRVLVEYGETGVWRGSYHATRIKLPECHREAWERYRAHVAASGVKKRTAYHKAHFLKGFLNFLAFERGVDDVSAMSAEDALAKRRFGAHRSLLAVDARLSPAGWEICFDPRAYLAMQWHDRDDIEGVEAIRHVIGQNALSHLEIDDLEAALPPGAEADPVLVYRVFKDADGLDRVRLGAGEPDPRYLRTSHAIELLDLAREMLRASCG